MATKFKQNLVIWSLFSKDVPCWILFSGTLRVFFNKCGDILVGLVFRQILIFFIAIKVVCYEILTFINNSNQLGISVGH